MEWITCENTYDEVWRRLMEYANVELATSAIENFHGKAPNKRVAANYRKQAEQTRVCLLQAREYFEAARLSSLVTQPNHLYYGIVALSSACMLIRGDGSHSLDFLRRDNKNAHHGLDFTFSSDQKRAKEGLSLLENSYVRVCPNGHFFNWYSTLSPSIAVHGLETQVTATTEVKRLVEIGSYDIPKFSELVGIKEDLMFLTKRLPDLHSELGRYGVDLAFARGDHDIRTDTGTGNQEHTFTFHHAPSHDALLGVVDQFSCDSGVNFEYKIMAGKTNGSVGTRKDKNWAFSYPNSRTTGDHKTIFYAEDINSPEVVDLYVISFCLSMLSRYYPDIWVSFLESHCKGAKLVERIVMLLLRRTPNLILNQISGRDYIISNHRPYWH